MKLIIDIPEITINNIKYYGTFLDPEDEEALQRAFRNSKSLNNILNKIKAEIRKKMKFNSFNEGYVLYDDITGVLDKYKVESEVNE